jgi:hypothetical protein
VSTPRSFYVPLAGNAAEALRELSRREFRHPREQAALFVVEGLRRAGALPSDQADTDSGPTAALEAVK